MEPYADPRYHQNIPVPYLTFPDSPICIIFQMTFSVTYFISDNGTLNLVKCIRAMCVYFCGEVDDADGRWSRAVTKRPGLSVRSCTQRHKSPCSHECTGRFVKGKVMCQMKKINQGKRPCRFTHTHTHTLHCLCFLTRIWMFMKASYATTIVLK